MDSQFTFLLLTGSIFDKFSKFFFLLKACLNCYHLKKLARNCAPCAPCTSSSAGPDIGFKIYLLFCFSGETDANKERRLQGQIDTTLNESGIRQAKAAGQALKNVTFHRGKYFPYFLDGKGKSVRFQ